MHCYPLDDPVPHALDLGCHPTHTRTQRQPCLARRRSRTPSAGRAAAKRLRHLAEACVRGRAMRLARLRPTEHRLLPAPKNPALSLQPTEPGLSCRTGSRDDAEGLPRPLASGKRGGNGHRAASAAKPIPQGRAAPRLPRPSSGSGLLAPSNMATVRACRKDGTSLAAATAGNGARLPSDIGEQPISEV